MKPLILYSNASALNPLKTSLLLSILSIPHEIVNFTFQPRPSPESPYLNAISLPSSSSTSSADHILKLNPDGRVPFLHDPNSGVSVAESNAIARYLIATYDGEGTWQYGEGKEKWEGEMWLDFQVGQQCVVFQQAYILSANNLNPTYLKTLQSQMKRTIGALDRRLRKLDNSAAQSRRREWLVGSKPTIADLSFVVWDMPQVLDVCFRGDEEVDSEPKRKEKWPEWAGWHERILRLDGVADFLGKAEALRK